MMEVQGKIDSVYCGSGVDGTGLRCVVFFSGCNLRCPFCHNPETLYKEGQAVSVSDLVNRIKRYKGYFRRGGVTLSGGEPFLQKKFYVELVQQLHLNNIHVCVETNGHIHDSEMISLADCLICDIKNQESNNFVPYERLGDVCAKLGKQVRLTNVLVPGKNDSREKIKLLADLVKKYFHQTSIHFLPFRSLCQEKYRALGKEFLYSDIQDAQPDDVKNAEIIFQDCINC